MNVSKKQQATKSLRGLLWFCFLVCGFMVTVLTKSTIVEASQTFPSKPFNGLQVQFTVSGASLGEPERHDSFTKSLSFPGVLAQSSQALQIQGTATAARGHYANLHVSIQVGSKQDSYQVKIEKGTQGAFNVSVPITADARSGSFTINLTGNYANSETRGVVVAGQFSTSGEPDIKGDSSWSENKKRPYVITPGPQGGKGEAWGYAKKVIINGETVTSFKDIPLYPGSQIKTDKGVEIVVRHKGGSVIRVLEDTQYEIKKRTFKMATRQEVYGRLVKGICEFYWPKGYKGAKKFEVETNRAIVGIKGTVFSVAHKNDITTVEVQEGIVEVTDRVTGVVKMVRAGSSVTVSEDQIADRDRQPTAPQRTPINNNNTRRPAQEDIVNDID